MTTKKTTKSIAQSLSGLLDKAKKSKPKIEKAHNLTIEFLDKETEGIYHYIIFNRGNEFRNLSTISKDGKTTYLNQEDITLVEGILDKLKDNRYKLIEYNSKWDVAEAKSFNEDELRHFVMMMKEKIIDKMSRKSE